MAKLETIKSELTMQLAAANAQELVNVRFSLFGRVSCAERCLCFGSVSAGRKSTKSAMRDASPRRRLPSRLGNRYVRAASHANGICRLIVACRNLLPTAPTGSWKLTTSQVASQLISAANKCADERRVVSRSHEPTSIGSRESVVQRRQQPGLEQVRDCSHQQQSGRPTDRR